MTNFLKLNLHRFEVSDEIAIEVVASSEKASSALKSLDSNIAKTIQNFDNLRIAIENTSYALKNFKNDASGLSPITKELKDATKDISSGFSSIVSSSMGGSKAVKQMAAAIESGKNSVKGHNNEVNKSQGILTKFVARLNETTAAMNNTKGATNTSINAFSGLTKSLTGTMVRFRIISGTIKAIANGFLSLTNKAADYEEALNLYTVSLGEYKDEGVAWAKEISDALYLDPTTIYQYEGALNSLISGLNVAADKSYLMSTNLTQLAFDMSSYLNIDYKTAYDRIQSGISGQIKGLRQAGIALTEASLEELRYSLGIDKSVRSMTESEKAQLRYIQIMRSTINMQGDLGRTLITPQNALRVTAQQFQLLGRAIGSVFIPIVMKAIPFVMALTQVLTDLANRLAKLFGYQIKDIDYSSLDNARASVKDLGASADSTKKKLKEMLAPFDELNVVQSSSKKDGGAGLGDTIDFSKWLTGYDMLAGLTDDLKNKTEAAIGPAKILLSIFGLLFGIKMASSLANLVGSIGKMGIGLTKGGKAIEALPALSKPALIAGGKILALVGAIAIGMWGFGETSSAVKKVLTSFTDLNKGMDNTLTLSEKLGIGILGAVGIATGTWLPMLIGTTGFGGVQLAIEKSTKSVDIFDKSISDATKQKVQPLVDDFNKLNKTINDFKFGKKIIKDEDVKTVKEQVKKISNSIIEELDADKNEQLSNLKVLEKTMGLTNYQNIIDKTNKYYTDQKNIVNTNEKEINNIIGKAKKENRELTEEELTKLGVLQQSTLDTGLKAMSETDEEYAKLRIRIGNETNKLNVNQASEYLKTAKDTKDKAIKNAEEQYVGIVFEAQKMVDAGVITKGEYADIVSAAETTKDETIKDAEEQYDGILKETKEGLGDNAKYIDDKTGEVKTNWQVWCDDLKAGAAGIWTSISDGISTWWNEDVVPWWNKYIAPIFTTTFWSEKWDTLKTAAKQKLEELRTSISDKWTGIKNWFRDNIAPKFTKEYWMKKFDSLVQGAKDKLHELKNKFENWKATIKTPHMKWDNEKGFKATGVIKKALEALNLPTSIPKLKVDWYQDGGFPTSGDLFFANENGVPEYITSIGGKSAVANQDQMVSALTNAIMAGLSQVNTNNQPSTTNVYIGKDKVYSGQGEYQNRQSDRYGTTNIIKV